MKTQPPAVPSAEPLCHKAIGLFQEPVRELQSEKGGDPDATWALRRCSTEGSRCRDHQSSPRLLDFFLLHSSHRSWIFLAVLDPPLDTGMM